MNLSEQRRLFNNTAPADKKGYHIYLSFYYTGKVMSLVTANIKPLLSQFVSFCQPLNH